MAQKSRLSITIFRKGIAAEIQHMPRQTFCRGSCWNMYRWCRIQTNAVPFMERKIVRVMVPWYLPIHKAHRWVFSIKREWRLDKHSPVIHEIRQPFAYDVLLPVYKSKVTFRGISNVGYFCTLIWVDVIMVSVLLHIFTDINFNNFYATLTNSVPYDMLNSGNTLTELPSLTYVFNLINISIGQSWFLAVISVILNYFHDKLSSLNSFKT